MFPLQSRNYVVIFVLLSIGVFFSHAFNCDEIQFRLYTSSQKIGSWVLKADGSPPISTTAFDPRRPTRIFIHGYNSWQKLIDEFRAAYRKLGDFNFIGVDWLEGACTINYMMAKGRIPKVAAKLAKLLDTLQYKHGLDMQDVTIVGHSLGAHIAGLTGKHLKSKNKIGCIIGLDPASVGFSYSKIDERLDKADAEYVQVIHTDINKFGFRAPIGHADFYPNGGKNQPGCGKPQLLTLFHDQCSHARSHRLYLMSLFKDFIAVHCINVDIKTGGCESDNVNAFMGRDITKYTHKPYGMFYLETTDKQPYVIPDPRNFKHASNIKLDDSDSMDADLGEWTRL